MKRPLVGTQEEVALIRQVCQMVLAERRPPLSQEAPEPTLPGRGTYIARTPPDGIPALSEGADTGTGTGSPDTYDDVPGAAECYIYRIENAYPGASGAKSLRPIDGLTRTVHNLAPVPIAGGNWIVVHLDAFGVWVAPNAGLDFAECP